MSPPTITPSLSHTLNIIKDLSAKIILDPHFRQSSREIEDLFVRQLGDFAGRVDVETGHYTRGGCGADSEEVFERFLVGLC